ncbi:MAG TPA: sigma-54 dependent transcriptional regulator, partial [bacterium]|nr:sigma-54 dependent transcriptional regulator [bacterium]
DLDTDVNALYLIKKLKKIKANTNIVVLSKKSNVSNAVECMKAGAIDYIVQPFSADKILDLIDNFFNIVPQQLDNNIEKEKVEDYLDYKIIGANIKLQKILKKVQIVANTKVSVLVTGESGTGKELIARAIHNLSDRRDKPFITFNCAALPANLIESELFGYEKGAFTGAIRTQIGKFEAANDGTLFIDEIGDMDLAVQAKLLRVLETREITRLGTTKSLKINTRFIFATNKELLELVQKNQFREDLYYRINVVKFELPPLRERRDDIPELFKYYFKLFCKEYNKKITYIAPDVLKTISLYYWPGNIRQFRNVIENLVVLNETGKIKFEDLPEEIIKDHKSDIYENRLEFKGYQPSLPVSNNLTDSGDTRLSTLAEIEKNTILNTLKSVNYNRTKAAQILNVSLRTIQRKIKEYGLEIDELKNNN